MTDTFKKMFSARMLIALAMGFSSGLPLLLIGGTLKAWFTEAKVDLTLIGLFSLVGLPYTFKFLWAPLLDRYIPPFLGRRRGWMLVSQIGLAILLAAFAFVNPATDLAVITVLALAVAFVSATQDIALDAYRREIFSAEEFGFGNSVFISGYRIAMLFASAFALILADHVSWPTVYLVMAASMTVGAITTFIAREPTTFRPPRNLKEAFVEPFVEYFQRPGALWILAFVVLYKLGDLMASEMTTPFYLQIGFTKTQIGATVKVFGIWSIIVGGLVGGAAMLRIGLKRALWAFGVLQAVTILGFAWLARVGADAFALAGVVTLENFTAGMGTAAYTAFMAAQTNRRFTATQYALMSSLMSLPRTILSAPTGYIAKNVGWEMFFVICTLCAIPGLLLLLKVGKWAEMTDEPNGV